MMEFYLLNPKLILRYQPFLAKRREKSAEDTHFDGWVFGQYFSASISANFSKRSKYPREPLFQMDMNDAEDEEAHVMTDAERFSAWVEAFNASRKDLEVIDIEEIQNNKKDIIDVEANELKTVDNE